MKFFLNGIKIKKKPQKELLFFFILSYLLSWLPWAIAIMSDNGIFRLPSDLLLKAGSFMPSIAAIILTALFQGKTGLLKLLNRFFRIRFKALWYFYSFFLMPVIMIIAFLCAHYFTGLNFNSLLLPLILPNVWPVLLIIPYFIIMQGPLGEELGWRGFALNRLFAICSPIKSSLVLGIVWSAWHIPLFFIQGSIQCSLANYYGIGAALLGYTFSTTITAIFMTLLHIKTGGSILMAMVFHGMSNFSHGLVTIIANLYGAVSTLIIMFIIAAVIVFIFRKQYFIGCNL